VIKKLKSTDGFKSFKLTTTSFKKWQNLESQDISEIQSSIELFAEDPLISDWTKDKLISEIFLTEGFPLSSKLKRFSLNGNELFNISATSLDNQLIICLDKRINNELINQLNLASNEIFICLDSAIDNEGKLRLSDKGLIKTI